MPIGAKPHLLVLAILRALQLWLDACLPVQPANASESNGGKGDKADYLQNAVVGHCPAFLRDWACGRAYPNGHYQTKTTSSLAIIYFANSTDCGLYHSGDGPDQKDD